MAALVRGAAPTANRRRCLVGARILNPRRHRAARGASRGEVTPVTTLLSLTRLAHVLRPLPRAVRDSSRARPGRPAELMRRCSTISGACFAIRRYDFFSVGGFDAGYFLHVEDVDLCWRVRRPAGRCCSNPRPGDSSRLDQLQVAPESGVLERCRARAIFPQAGGQCAARGARLRADPLHHHRFDRPPRLAGQAFKRRGGLRF